MLLRIFAAVLLLAGHPDAFAKSLTEEAKRMAADINYMIQSWAPLGTTLEYYLEPLEGGPLVEKNYLIGSVVELRDRMGGIVWRRNLSARPQADIEEILFSESENRRENFRYIEVAGSEGSVYEFLLEHPEFRGADFVGLEHARRHQLDAIWTTIKDKPIPTELNGEALRFWAYRQALDGLSKIGMANVELSALTPNRYRNGNIRDNLTLTFSNSRKEMGAFLFHEKSTISSTKTREAVVEHTAKALTLDLLQQLRFRPVFFRSVGMQGSPLLDFTLAACNAIESRILGVHQAAIRQTKKP